MESGGIFFLLLTLSGDTDL